MGQMQYMSNVPPPNTDLFLVIGCVVLNGIKFHHLAGLFVSDVIVQIFAVKQSIHIPKNIVYGVNTSQSEIVLEMANIVLIFGSRSKTCGALDGSSPITWAFPFAIVSLVMQKWSKKAIRRASRRQSVVVLKKYLST